MTYQENLIRYCRFVDAEYKRFEKEAAERVRRLKAGLAEHEQKPIELWDGSTISVDAGVAGLIQAMNGPGLQTLFSCEGGHKLVLALRDEDEDEEPSVGREYKDGYVLFAGTEAKPFLRGMLKLIEDHSVQKLDFHIGIPRYPGSYSMRWTPHDYETILGHAKKVLA